MRLLALAAFECAGSVLAPRASTPKSPKNHTSPVSRRTGHIFRLGVATHAEQHPPRGIGVMSANEAFAAGFVRVREIADKMGLPRADHGVGHQGSSAPPAGGAIGQAVQEPALAPVRVAAGASYLRYMGGVLATRTARPPTPVRRLYPPNRRPASPAPSDPRVSGLGLQAAVYRRWLRLSQYKPCPDSPDPRKPYAVRQDDIRGCLVPRSVPCAPRTLVVQLGLRDPRGSTLLHESSTR